MPQDVKGSIVQYFHGVKYHESNEHHNIKRSHDQIKHYFTIYLCHMKFHLGFICKEECVRKTSPPPLPLKSKASSSCCPSKLTNDFLFRIQILFCQLSCQCWDLMIYTQISGFRKYQSLWGIANKN